MAKEFEGTLYNSLDRRATSLFETLSSEDQFTILEKTQTDDIQRRELLPFSKEDHIEDIDSAFSYLFGAHRPHLGHYFRQIYHLLKFVDDSKITEDRKKAYVDIIQSHLENIELVLIACYGLSKHGQELKVLIERYGLLESVTPGSLLHGEHARLYKASAFGNREYKHERD